MPLSWNEIKCRAFILNNQLKLSVLDKYKTAVKESTTGKSLPGTGSASGPELPVQDIFDQDEECRIRCKLRIGKERER